MIPDGAESDPVVARWQTFFAPIDWTGLDQVRWRRPGPVPHPPSAYCKALLIKLHEHLPSIPRLRAYLLEHPALVTALGFRVVWATADPPRIDWERTVPSERWLRHQQQHLPAAWLEQVLTSSVQVVQTHLPTLGTTVAIDTTHRYAYVRENNPNDAPAHAFARDRRPRGDRDCALGVKVQGNQRPRRKSWLFGYGCGMAAAPIPGGAVVVATVTQPVNRQDITYLRPLLAQATATLGAPPVHLTADAAFDAWWAYETVRGLAAIAANPRTSAPPTTETGNPICAAGHPMRPTRQGQHEDGYRVQHYGCPLRGTGELCADPRFGRGGCRKRRNRELGAQTRATLDRTDPAYRALYRQRTCVERCFSQAKALGLERPNVRTQAAVDRLATLTAITLNLRTIARHFPLQHPIMT